MLTPNENIKNMPHYDQKSLNKGNSKPTVVKAKLASIENFRSIPTEVENKLKEIIKELHLYPRQTLNDLYYSLAHKLTVGQDNLIFGNGADEILQLIALTYLNPEREALISESSFAQYTFVTNLVGAKQKVVPLENYSVSLRNILNAISEQTSVIFLCNPNNPTGTYFTEADLINFLDKVPDNILVVIDEVFFEYATAEDFPNTPKLLTKYKNIVIVRSFSKIWSLAGLRLGYAISSEEIIQFLNKAKQPFNINRFAIDAGVLMLEQDEWKNKILEDIKTQKDFLYKGLDSLGLKYIKSEANFIFIYLPMPAEKIAEDLMVKGVAVRTLSSFDIPNAIRVKVGLYEENKLFLEEMKNTLVSLDVTKDSI